MRKKTIILFFILITSNIYAQYYKEGDIIINKATIIDGDTVPVFWIPQVKIIAPIIFKNKRQAIAWSRLVRKVKKVYPYAKLAAKKMEEYDKILAPIDKSRDKKKQVNLLQDELFAEFETELKKLTISEGKILVKLIDRETSYTTYNIIKDYRGGIIAGFWQITGSIFGYDLKEPYDPKGKDKEIETIVIMIKNH